jgi:hypothetical protein
MTKTTKKNQTIEQERGETYAHATFAVYEHSTYPRYSVLAGQPCRRFIDGGFKTIEDAQAKYPDARVIPGTTHIPVDDLTRHLPGDDDPDPFGDYDPGDY